MFGVRGRPRVLAAPHIEVLVLTPIILLLPVSPKITKKSFRFDLEHFRSESQFSSRDGFLAENRFFTKNGRYLDEHAVFVQRENLIKRELVEQIWRSKKEAKKIDLANKVMTQMTDQQRNISKKGKVSIIMLNDFRIFPTKNKTGFS